MILENRRASVLCQMNFNDRLNFISRGLPIILQSADGYWRAARQIKERSREAEVLQGYSLEECAKILILLDAVRCPRNLISSRIGAIVKWFYCHLARLIYADSITWSVFDVNQLRKYVDESRQSLHLEGDFGEYIVPNLSKFHREIVMYADVQSITNEEPRWIEPSHWSIEFLDFEPPLLTICKTMSELGMFTTRGLNAMSEIFGDTYFNNQQTFMESANLTKSLIERLIEENLPSSNATEKQVRMLVEQWQIPMYDFDFSQTSVPVEQLEEVQDQILLRLF